MMMEVVALYSIHQSLDLQKYTQTKGKQPLYIMLAIYSIIN
jgi:hypothetical protein